MSFINGRVEGMSRSIKKMRNLQLTPLTERYEETLATYSKERIVNNYK